MSEFPKEAITLTGGCHCKQIRYSVAFPALQDRPIPQGRKLPTSFPLISLDHCDSCRKASGVWLQCWMIIPHDWVTFTITPSSSSSPATTTTEEEGEGTIELKGTRLINAITGREPVAPLSHYESSENANRTFCGKCGANLTFHWTGPSTPGFPPSMDITLGSLDHSVLKSTPGLSPDRHGWWEDRLPWIEELLTKGDAAIEQFKNPGGVKRDMTASASASGTDGDVVVEGQGLGPG